MHNKKITPLYLDDGHILVKLYTNQARNSRGNLVSVHITPHIFSNTIIKYEIICNNKYNKLVNFKELLDIQGYNLL